MTHSETTAWYERSMTSETRNASLPVMMRSRSRDHGDQNSVAATTTTITITISSWDLYLSVLTVAISAAAAAYFAWQQQHQRDAAHECDDDEGDNLPQTGPSRWQASDTLVSSSAKTPRRSNSIAAAKGSAAVATKCSSDDIRGAVLVTGSRTMGEQYRRLVTFNSSQQPLADVSQLANRILTFVRSRIPLWAVWGVVPAYYCVRQMASLPSSTTTTHSPNNERTGLWICWGAACLVTFAHGGSQRPATTHDGDVNDHDDDDTTLKAENNGTEQQQYPADDTDAFEAMDTLRDLSEESATMTRSTLRASFSDQQPAAAHFLLGDNSDKSTLIDTAATTDKALGKPPIPRQPLPVPALIAPSIQQQHHKYLELLVHNVSHTDVIFGLDIVLADGASLDVPVTVDSEQVQETDSCPDQNENYMRPRFSSFDLFCRLVLQHMTATTSPATNRDTVNSSTKSTISATVSTHGESGHAAVDGDQIFYFPRYQRSMDDPRYSIRDLPAGSNPPRTPTGFKLRQPVAFPSQVTNEDVRIRENEEATILSVLNDSHRQRSLAIGRVFFPLLATILPVWHRHIQEKEYHSPVKRVLILVTGVGTPRNQTHSADGNSTQACAELMRLFLARVDPTLTVVSIHSTTNVFRYDENLLFCERELMPTINAYRDAHATKAPYPDEIPALEASTKGPRTNRAWSLGERPQAIMNFDESDWRTSMHVTLSFADGSPARTHAIQASLRSYKPTYFHFWQLKTFWHESKVVDDDIEVHSFETMETLPAVDADRVRDPDLQLVVHEMRSFYQQMTLALLSGNNDIHRFWLRKTHKPVLAVLLVQPASGEPRLYRGTNMEVSMPTGSLCAERSAIGSALASNPNLKRHDLKLIAVLAVPPVESISGPNPSTDIPGSSNNSHHSGAMASPSDVVGGRGGVMLSSSAMRRVSSYSSIVVDDEDRQQAISSRKSSFGSEYEPLPDEWILSEQANDPLNSSICSATTDDGTGGLMSNNSEPLRRISLFSKMTPLSKGTAPPSTGDSVPSSHAAVAAAATTHATHLRRSGNHGNSSKANKRRTVVVLSAKDNNPLAPCGACNEWLKKIAESNPYFRIVTFTDANCNGIYVSPCKE